MQSNARTIANALECVDDVRRANPQAALRMHPTVDGGVSVCVDGVDVTDVIWAAVLPEEEHCPHCKMDPCQLEEHEEQLIHHGDGLVVNGETHALTN